MAPAGKQSPNNDQRSMDRRLKYLDREMARHSYSQSGLLEILFKANSMFGHLPDDILRYIATSLQIAPSRVYAAATFYTRFRLSPGTEPDVRICNGVTCLMNGATALSTALIGPEGRPGKARCSGLCSHGPIAHVHGATITEATPDAIKRLLQETEGEPA
jgi:NADH:ubiquinone oxidoreductase subunit E